MKVLNCSKCGSYAVTMNGTSCISIRSGKLCGGKISKIERVPDGLLEITYPEEDNYDYAAMIRHLERRGWKLEEHNTYKKDDDLTTKVVMIKPNK